MADDYTSPDAPYESDYWAMTEQLARNVYGVFFGRPGGKRQPQPPLRAISGVVPSRNVEDRRVTGEPSDAQAEAEYDRLGNQLQRDIFSSSLRRVEEHPFGNPSSFQPQDEVASPDDDLGTPADREEIRRQRSQRVLRFGGNDPLDPITGRTMLPGTVPTSVIDQLLGQRGIPNTPGTNALYRKWLASLQPDLTGFPEPANALLPVLAAARRMAPALNMPWRPSDYDDWRRPSVELDILRAFNLGLDDSPFGSFVRWTDMRRQIGWDADPQYDPWADNSIRERGFRDQMHLFTGSTSAPMSQWIMGRSLERQREAEVVDRMGSTAALATFGGGLIGDPTTYLPATLGVKGAELASKARLGMLSGAEIKMLATPYRTPLGAIADGVRNAAINGAVLIAERAAQGEADPTLAVHSIAEELTLPTVLSLSVGTLVSGLSRRGATSVLKQVGTHNFLNGVAPAGRPWSAEELEALKAGRPFSLLAGEIDPNAPPVPPAPRERATAPTGQGSVGAALSEQSALYDRERLLQQGRLVGQNGLPINGVPNGGHLTPGALATGYGEIRMVEIEKDDHIRGLIRQSAAWKRALQTDDFNQFMDDGGIVDAESRPLVGYHGTRRWFSIFSNSELGSTTGAASAQMGHFFASNPETSGLGYTFWNERKAMVPTITKPGLFRRLFSRDPHKMAEKEIFEDTGGQIRPTYLRMKNPYVITDRKPIDMDAMHISHSDLPGEGVIRDMDGNWWKLTTEFDDAGPSNVWVRQSLEPSGIRQQFMGEVIDDHQFVDHPSGEMRDVIQTLPLGRTIQYAREIAKAKRLGHDGVIIRETVDGGGPNVRTDVYVVFDPLTQTRAFDQRWKVPSAGSTQIAGHTVMTPPDMHLFGIGPTGQNLKETDGFITFSQNNKVRGRDGRALQVYHATGGDFVTFSDEATGSTTERRWLETLQQVGNKDPRAELRDPSTPFGSRVALAAIGHWFTASAEEASEYAMGLAEQFGERASPQVRPSYLRMTNPLIIDGYKTVEVLADPRVSDVLSTRVDVDGIRWTYAPVGNEGWWHAPGQTPTQVIKLYGPIQYTADDLLAAQAKGFDGVIIKGAGTHADEFVVFKGEQVRNFDQRYELPGGYESKEMKAAREQPGSVGAALSMQSQIYQREVLLQQGRMVPTGIGLERLPLDPVQRAFLGSSLEAMRAVTALVSTGGRITLGNQMGIANDVPVEALIAVRWRQPMVEVVRDMHDNWAAYRASLAKTQNEDAVVTDFTARSDAQRLTAEAGAALKNLFSRGERGMSFAEFRSRVGKTLNQGDADPLADGASPFVEKAAAKQRALYERIKKEADDVGLFEEAYEAAKWQAYSDVRALKTEADDLKRQATIERWTPDQLRTAEEALLVRMEDAEFKAKQKEDWLNKLAQDGPALNGTARSYRPRLYDVGELERGEAQFVDTVSSWLQSKNGGRLDQQEAVRVAKEIHTTLTHQNPIYERGDLDALFKSVNAPSSAKARSLTIPDDLIERFLVNDAEVLMRYHVNQMGTGIEMMRRFGTLDLRDEIAAIEREYRGLIEDANRGSDVATPRAKELVSEMKGAIKDVQALRDKLYGTYGAAENPHAWTSRTIRMAKQFSNLTLLGLAGVTALGDLVRPLMTEGMEATYGHGLRSLFSESRNLIMRMTRGEMELAGDCMELMNNVRALQATDTGDVFGHRGKFEHFMSAANQWMFVANGMNAVTQYAKQWSGLIIQARVNKALLAFVEDIDVAALGRGEDARSIMSRLVEKDGGLVLETGSQLPEVEVIASKVGFSARDRARFAAVGIDETMARRIGIQIKIHKQDFNSISIANTTKWDDDLARETYRAALYQMVNRTVPTPGRGDTANWMSTELGGLISQYKSFGVGAVTRVLTSGLQEDGKRFWYGAAAAVGFAAMLNEVRSRLFYDRSTFDRPATAVIADAIDRSSILGWFSDVNRAIEILSGHRAGFRPLTGAESPRDARPQEVAGLAGPSAGQAFRAGSVLNDYLTNHVTARTYDNWRRLTPGAGLPWVDPIADRVISDGNFRRPAAPRQETKSGPRRHTADSAAPPAAP